MNKNIGIYPYFHNWKPILHYRKFLFPDSELYGIVHSSESDKQKLSEYLVPYTQYSFETLMITEKFNDDNFQENILSLLKQGKRIENFKKLSNEELCIFSRYKNFCDFSRCKNPFISNFEHVLLEISVPVIFVLGMHEDLDKFAVQIALRKILMDNSIVVSQIGTRACCEKFGFHSFPQFMFDSIYSPEEKIYLFNHYVAQIIKEEFSDVLIIGIPGAYTKLNKKNPMGFGILPYIISQAVTPDFSVMCTFYAEVDNENFFKMMSQNCKFRLGFEIDCFHMSGTYIDMMVLKENGKVKYTHMPDESVTELLKIRTSGFESCIFNVYETNGEKKLTDKLFDTLCPSYEEIDVLW